jgi:hypothetical protein
LADAVDRKRAVDGVALRDGGEQLYRLANVARCLAAAGLVEDAIERGCECCGVCGEQHFSAGRDGGDASGEVDRSAEEVAVALDAGPW